MYSNEMAFLGLSNSELFLTQKDSKPIKSKFLSIPTFEFLHDLPQQEEKEQQETGEGEFLLKKQSLVSSTSEEEEEKIKMPRTPTGDQLKKMEETDEENDGFRTPTSLDKKIRINNNPQCPPAPKKPKSAPVSSCRNKRKASSSRIYKIDLLKEVKLMIPHHQEVLADHDLGSKIIKKVRTN